VYLTLGNQLKFLYWRPQKDCKRSFFKFKDSIFKSNSREGVGERRHFKQKLSRRKFTGNARRNCHDVILVWRNCFEARHTSQNWYIQIHSRKHEKSQEMRLL